MFANRFQMLRFRFAMTGPDATHPRSPRCTPRRALRRIVATTAATAIALAGAIVSSSPSTASDGWTDVLEDAVIVRPIVYPVGGDVYYTDTWLAPRGSGRRHLGVDLMGDKLIPLLAARAGCITWLRWGGVGGGNMLTLTDEEGWEYRYIHINNDSPGTDDGANPYEWAFTVNDGDCVEAGQHIAYLGDSGNAEGTGAHLHFEIRQPDGYWINPYHSVLAAQQSPLCTSPDVNPGSSPDAASARGYWMLDSAGRVHAYNTPHFGDLESRGVGTPPASMAATPSGDGYWIVDEAGLVHAFGGAAFHGDMRAWTLNGPILRIEPHPTGDGYWLVASDGGVFTFGVAQFHGSMGARQLNAPVISLSATPDGGGYFLVAGDGGVFTFGNASFRGSTGDLVLAASVIDMAVPSSGTGYWLYAGDGGVFTFGSLGFHGSGPGTGRCDLAPSVALRVSDTGAGYWIALASGEVLAFGDAMHHGDSPDLHIDDPDDPDVHTHATIVDLAVRRHGPT